MLFIGQWYRKNVGSLLREIGRQAVKLYQVGLVGAGLVCVIGSQAVNGTSVRQAAAPNAQIERGRYIVEIGGCNDCHTPGYAEAGGKAAETDRLKGDRLGFRGPWGTTYPTNLRLSISKLTEAQWLTYSKNLNTRPPMPWFNVRAMTDEDLKAVYAYIKQLPGGLGTAAPTFLTPDKAPQQPFIQWPGVK
jgi:mono/diheme cytochrome c family protein